jgi:hypothetical protein
MPRRLPRVGAGDLDVAGAVLALLDPQRPFVQVAGLLRLPQMAPGGAEVVQGAGDVNVVGAVLSLGQLEQALPRRNLGAGLPAGAAEASDAP